MPIVSSAPTTGIAPTVLIVLIQFLLPHSISSVYFLRVLPNLPTAAAALTTFGNHLNEQVARVVVDQNCAELIRSQESANGVIPPKLLPRSNRQQVRLLQCV